MKLFVLTFDCHTQVHCETCRGTDQKSINWRARNQKFFDFPFNDRDFVCPFGKPWNYVQEGPIQKMDVMNPIYPIVQPPELPYVEQADTTTPMDASIPRVARKCGGCRRNKPITQMEDNQNETT